MKTCTIKRLLCCCIWLFISKGVVACQLPIASAQTKTPKTSGQQTTNHQPPTTNHQLPCLTSEPDCLQILGDLAVHNNRELALLEQTLRLQKKKLWTNWLSADGLNPLTISLRVIRNLVGGGERAAAKLEIARLEWRQAEQISQIHNQITQAVFAYEVSQQQLAATKDRLTAHQTRLQFSIIEYRLGGVGTETMLQLWQTETELQRDIEQARSLCHQRLILLQLLLIPQMDPSPHK
jgi:hypothetical protein